MKWFGIELPPVTRKEALARLDQAHVIFTPNPEILLEASQNDQLKLALQSADLLLPDGHGLQMVSTLRRLPKALRAILWLPGYLGFLFFRRAYLGVYPEVIHGSDFMVDVLRWACDKQQRVFFLGAREGVAEKTAEFFKAQLLGLSVAGFSAANPSPELVSQLKTLKPDVLLVAYGAPKQELFIAENLEAFASIRLIMGVGGSFDYWSGSIARAPKFMQRLGLEWVVRLFKEPRKRAGRIWNAVVVFPFKSLFFDEI